MVSGLTLHVIKIFRDQRSIRQRAPGLMRQHAEMRRYFRKAMVDFLLDQSHGGWFEMQNAEPALLPAEAPGPGDTLSASAASAEEIGRWEEAPGHYEHALRLNPHHTYALVGLARVQYERGRMAEALLAHEKALWIEPNRCDYYLSLAALAYQCGLPYKTLDTYEAMKRCFPYQEDTDELVAAALVSCGEPEQTLELLARLRPRAWIEQMTVRVSPSGVVP